MAHEHLPQEELDNLKVKAHDVRGLAASWALHKGVAFEDIMSSCHWKSHNTFTQFYLKECTWSNNDDLSLGPFVTAQSIVSSL